MRDRYLEATTSAIDQYAAIFSPDMPFRRLRVFLHIAEVGPCCAKDVAKYFRAPESTIRDDINALTKTGLAKHPGYRVLDEMPPLAPKRPYYYRLSKKGEELVEVASCRAHVALMPTEDECENEMFFAALEHTRC